MGRLLLALTVLGLALPAHAENKEIARLQLQVANLQGQVISLQRSMDEALQELRRLNEALAQQGNALRSGLEDGRIQNEASQAALRDVVDRLGELRESLVAMRESGVGLPAPGLEQGGPEMASESSGGSGAPPPRELYSQAYADFARGNYDLAIQGFQTYLQHYPETEFSDNAQYWIGECYYGQQRFGDAVDAWNALLRDFETSDKVPDARVKKGMALERLGRRSQALLEYRYVLDRYPNAPAARIAREKLNPNR